MRKNKKFIYLISPNKILLKNFYKTLANLFKTKKIYFFQLRLKNEKKDKLIKIAKKIKKIAKKYDVKFIVNDNPYVAKEVNADGCHIGQKDFDIKKARKILKNKILGVTCHNSISLSRKAIENGADYIALGAFFQSIEGLDMKIFIPTIKFIKEYKIIYILTGFISIFTAYTGILYVYTNRLPIQKYLKGNN